MHVGRYEVVLPLREGPLGRVLLARDPVVGRQVALKAMRADADLTADAKARLATRIRESGRAVGALSHPGFSTLHDMGDDDSGAPYLVFEFVKGPTLRERLAEGPVPPAEVASIGRALGAALTHAHAADFVHGDVKPENVMLSPVGPRLTDPGFAWLAREQTATPFDDQLGLAAVLYEALTGKPPSPGGTRLPPSAVAPNLRSFPHLDTIFDRALAADPRKRFSSCDVLGSVLATELEGFESRSSLAPASRSSIVPRATRRWQNAAAGAAVLVICALVLLGRQRHSPDEGVSLRSVSSAFFVAIGPPRSAPAPTHHPRPAPTASVPPGPPAASAAASGDPAEPAAPSADGAAGGDRSVPSPPP